MRYALIGYIGRYGIVLSTYPDYDSGYSLGEFLYEHGLVDGFSVAKTSGEPFHMPISNIVELLTRFWNTCDTNIIRVFPTWSNEASYYMMLGTCVERKHKQHLKEMAMGIVNLLYESEGYIDLDVVAKKYNVSSEAMEQLVKYLRWRYDIPVIVVWGKGKTKKLRLV